MHHARDSRPSGPLWTPLPLSEGAASQPEGVAPPLPATTPEALHPADIARRQRELVIRAVRIAFAILVVTFTMLSVFLAIQEGRDNRGPLWWFPVIGAVIVIVGVVAVDLLTPAKKISTIGGIVLGTVLGLLATLAIGGVLDLLLQSWLAQSEAWRALKPVVDSFKIVIGICMTYLGIVTILQTQDDFRLVIPYVEFNKQVRGVRPLLVDTSALVDGRIADIAGTNFIQAPLVIPQFVVSELQTLADSADSVKRAKGRRGLDMIARLQRSGSVEVTIDEAQVAGSGVDQMLVEMARSMPGMILTTDAALVRIAGIRGVQVLNLNDLANATKINLAPGEALSLRLTRPGEQPGQGVGYLPDGTMVVAEDGGDHIGQTVTMTVTSSLQTSAGRLIFARINPGVPGESPPVIGSGPHARRMLSSRPAHSQGSAPVAPMQHPPGPGPSPDLASHHTPGADTGQTFDDPQGTSHALTPTTPEDPGQPQQETDANRTNRDGEGDARPIRSPYPPKPPRTMKLGSPRNPRR